MKNLKYVVALFACVLLFSCAKERTFNIAGKDTVVHPYGFLNDLDEKNDSVVYRISIPDVVISVVFCESIIVPILDCGYFLFEPVRKLKPGESRDLIIERRKF